MIRAPDITPTDKLDEFQEDHLQASLETRVKATLDRSIRPERGQQTTDASKVMIADSTKPPTAARGRSRTRLQRDIAVGRNCDPGPRDVRPLRDERKSRSSRGAERSDGDWPMRQMAMNKGPQCLDQSRVHPALMLRQLAFAMRVSRALYVAAQLGVADLLAGGSMTSEQLTLAAGGHASELAPPPARPRGLWCLRGGGPGSIPPQRRGGIAKARRAGSQRAGVLFTAGDMTWQLWSDFLESVHTGHAVIERVFGKNVFERHAENSEDSTLFSEAMAAFSAALSPPLIAAYDFSLFKCVADIGGGTGRLLADILAANPEVEGVLFDLPDVSTAAPPLLEASGVAGRCKLVAGNFFESVPAGADAYMLKHILHDWDDARAIAIISNCRKAMARNATLLVVERVMPERAEQGRAAEAYLVDLEMLVHTPGGRERTESEFRAILSAAGFPTMRVVPTTTPVSVIEARPA